MRYHKTIKSSYFGLPLEYRVEHRQDKSGVHYTLILLYRACDDKTLHYEHPPRRINNWRVLVQEYIARKCNSESAVEAKTFLEFLPAEIMQDFCEGFLGLKGKRKNKKSNKKEDTTCHGKKRN